MLVRLIPDLGEVDAEAWDDLTGDDDPFVEHAFLRALEDSGTVGEGSGWLPCHLTLWDDDERLVGALPLYEKHHSYGEYIFDWGWADAAMRLGIRYYPKLVSMVPVTPATGRRLLVHPDADREVVVNALGAAALEVAQQSGASSLHVNFITKQERDELTVHPKFMARLTEQYHFHNEGYESFDDFLGRLRSPNRKQIRKERRRVDDAGLRIALKRGPELTERDWRALGHFYRDTCGRKGSHPYLTRRFFELLPERLAHRVVAVLAYQDDRPVAATLNFEKGKNIYGRYWGAEADFDMLHFELCYYRLIEHAIDNRMARFEAGAQGMHKLKRGLMPAAIHSAHFIAHPRLAEAIGEYLPREARATQQHLEELAERGPFKRS